MYIYIYHNALGCCWRRTRIIHARRRRISNALINNEITETAHTRLYRLRLFYTVHGNNTKYKCDVFESAVQQVLYEIMYNVTSHANSVIILIIVTLRCTNIIYN